MTLNNTSGNRYLSFPGKNCELMNTTHIDHDIKIRKNTFFL